MIYNLVVDKMPENKKIGTCNQYPVFDSCEKAKWHNPLILQGLCHFLYFKNVVYKSYFKIFFIILFNSFGR